VNVEAYRVWKPSNLVLLAIVLLSSWFTGQLILGAEASELLFLILPVVFVAFLFFTVKDWRSGLWLLCAWLLFEDIVRKFMGNNMIVYFGKDAIAGVVYLAFYAARRSGKIPIFRPPFWIPLVFFFWWTLLEVFNPNSPSLWYGVLGMKLFFYYVPLFFVGYAVFRNEADLQRFLQFNLFLAGVIALLGIIQAIIGPTFLNPANLAADIRDLSSLVRFDPVSHQIFFRPTSVFVSDGRYAYYMLMAWLLGAGSAAYWFVRQLPGKWYVLLIMGVISVALVLGGARASLLFASTSVIVLAGAFVWGLPGAHVWGARAKKAFAATLIVVGVAIVGSTVLYPEDVASRWGFYLTTLSPYSNSYELGQRAWTGPIGEIVKAFYYPNWLLGYGTGTCSLGVQYVTRILNVPRLYIGVESGYGALILETGVIGLLLWLLWTSVLVLSAWRVVKRLRRTALFPIGLVIAMFAFVVFFALTAMSNSGYENFVINAYVWLLLGILFRLPDLLPTSTIPPALKRQG